MDGCCAKHLPAYFAALASENYVQREATDLGSGSAYRSAVSALWWPGTQAVSQCQIAMERSTPRSRWCGGTG